MVEQCTDISLNHRYLELCQGQKFNNKINCAIMQLLVGYMTVQIRGSKVTGALIHVEPKVSNHEYMQSVCLTGLFTAADMPLTCEM